MKKVLALIVCFFMTMPVLAAQTYVIDRAHSSIEFSVAHMMLSKTTGSFSDYEGEIAFSPDDLQNSRFDVLVKAASMDTRNAARDQHLRGPDFFETDRYPVISFKTRKIVSQGQGQYTLVGELTMKDVTREVEVPVTILGPVDLPRGQGAGIGLSSRFQVNRQEYHINFNKKLDNGGLMVGDVVDVTVNLEAHSQ